MSTEYVSIARVTKQVRAARIVELPLNSMGDEQFALLRSGKKQREILGPAGQRSPDEEVASAQRHAAVSRQPVRGAAVDAGTGGAPLSQDELPQVPCAKAPRDARFGPAQGPPDGSDRKAVRGIGFDQDQIIRANLRLVVSIAKRYVCPAVEFYDLVSDGNMSLMRAAEKFERLTRQPVQHLRQLGDHEQLRPHHLGRDPSPGPFLHQSRGDLQHRRGRPHEPIRAGLGELARVSEVQGILKRLDKRERQIIEDRFGLTRGHDPRTLKQIGAAMGVSKERVRQTPDSEHRQIENDPKGSSPIVFAAWRPIMGVLEASRHVGARLFGGIVG